MNRTILYALQIATLGVLGLAATYGIFYGLTTDPAFDAKPRPAVLDAPRGDAPEWMSNHGKQYAD